MQKNKSSYYYSVQERTNGCDTWYDVLQVGVIVEPIYAVEKAEKLARENPLCRYRVVRRRDVVVYQT